MLKPIRLTGAVAFCAVAFFSHSILAADPPTFASPQVISTETSAAKMVMGDFDGDGIPDVAVMGAKLDTNGIAIGGSVEVYFGDGSNGFRSTTGEFTLNLPGGSYSGLAAADLTGSGQSQVIVAGSNNVVIINWTVNNFSLMTNLDLSATGINATFLAVGDLTGPGSRDILVCDRYIPFVGTIGVVWIPNDGKGNFGTSKVFQTWGSTGPPVLADVNGDGWVDVVLNSADSSQGGIGTNYLAGGGTVGVLLNNGDGTLGSEVFWGNTSLYGLTNSSGRVKSLNTRAVAVADVDGDGKADLISASLVSDPSDIADRTNYISVNLGNGDGTFQDGKAFPVTNGIVALDTGDLNDGGRVDCVTVDDLLLNSVDPGFTVTEFSGAGANLALARQDHFSTPWTQNEATAYSSLALGYKSTNAAFVTFNNDSKIDVLLGSGQNIHGASNTVHHQFLVFKNTTGTSLPPTSVEITGTITPGGPIQFSASQSSMASGLVVRIQYSTTPTVEGSWTNLPDGNGGHLTLNSSGAYTFGTNGTTFYPAGAAVYFRAITSAPGFTDSISTTILGPYALKQGDLVINARLTSTSDPTGALQIAHLGDTLTYTFTWTNIGDAPAHNLKVETPVPTYIDAASDVTLQFPSNSLAFSQYGSYSKESSAGANDATVTWTVSDLPPGYRQSVTLAVSLGSFVRLDQSIGLPNNYQVYSTRHEPPTSGTGYTSGAANVSTRVLAPISFTLVPEPTTVAPGGLLTYTFTVSNLTSAEVHHPVAVVDVPEWTRFATNYPTGPKTSVHGVAYVGRAGSPTYKQIYYENGDKSQLVIFLYPLPAQSKQKPGLETATFKVTFQAQWADPASVPSITSGDYLAAFVKPADFAAVSNAYHSAGNTPYTAGSTDFIAYLGDGSKDIALTKNESGVVTVALQGSLAAEPDLRLLKTLTIPVTDTQNDGYGKMVNLVRPGDEVTFLLVAGNHGQTEAEDVFIEDVMPNSTAFVSASLAYATPKAKSTPSTLQSAATGVVVQDPDGHHLRFEGLRLEADDFLVIRYTVKVFDGAKNEPAPAPGTFLDPSVAVNTNGVPIPASIGSSSLPQTPGGLYVSAPLEVAGPAQFAQPIVRSLVPHVIASADTTATANLLTTLYDKNYSAPPLANPSEPGNYIPGVVRYYIHYQNTSIAVKDAALDVPLPEHTVFYRAAWVKLPPNDDPKALGLLPGKLIAHPPGASIVAPAFLSNGVVTFKLPSPLPVGAGGDVMVEVIGTADGIQANGSLVSDPSAPPVSIHDSTVQREAGRVRKESVTLLNAHESTGPLPTLQLSDFLSTKVPFVGIMETVPQEVRQGDTFQVMFSIYNYSDVNVNPIVSFDLPQNAQFVSADAGQSDLIIPLDHSPGNSIGAILASGNGPETQGGWILSPHTGAALTVTLQATGAVGSGITNTNSYVVADFLGYVYAPPTSTQIVATNVTPSPATLTVHTGTNLFHTIVNNTDVAIIDIGGGNIVAQGAGNIVSQGAGNIVSQGAGNIVSQGAGNAIPIGATTAAALLADEAHIVAQGAGNVVSPAGSTIVAQGAGNLVAAGAGNIVSQGAGNIVSQGAGNIVSQGAGNIVAQGAGNIIAQGAGNYISAGGGAIVSQGAGNILASLPGSSASLRTSLGNMFSVGGEIFQHQ